jgi:hypothetical protein
MRSRSVLGSAVLVSLVAACASGCLERPLQPQDPRSTAMVVERIKLSAVERIDLLLAIDSSGSMADKQEILARAVPELVKRLANPRCIDAAGEPTGEQPPSPTDPCPAGSQREFLAVPDIHIGIVSSSLGGPEGVAGAYCTGASQNDKAHLLARNLQGGAVPTYDGLGFLAWDPDKKLDPPGESVLDAGTVGLVPRLQDMVSGVGESGCGYEGQLESWYRFLIQPDPYEKLVQKGDDLVPEGDDATILEQRKAFLRPDSLVAVLMLTDENDCSIAPGDGAARIFNKARMVKPRAECSEKGPDDPCCAPCDQAPPECAPQAACTDENGQTARLTAEEDHPDLRCFNQKERFGKDYLYPFDRYVKGLTELHVPDRYGKLTSNPLFMDLDLSDDLRGPRGPTLVYLAGIVGVPWQDIARDPTTLVKGLKSAKELAERDAQGRSTWDVILGDPAKGELPLDPHMIESTSPRTGTNPITGTDVAPVDSGPDADPISGHEQPTSIKNLQYACTFPLLEPRADADTCKTAKGDADLGDPLCQDASGAYSTTQLRAPAYPGLRELSVLKGIHNQAIVASVCPANMEEAAQESAPDFGYTPAIGALIDQLKGQLGHQCLPRGLTPTDDGQVSCLVIEARRSESCSCEAEDGRAQIGEDHIDAIQSARNTGLIDDSADCFCEIPQLASEELSACQFEAADPPVVDGEQVNGWCYIDATSVPAVGSPELVPEACASTERRLVRLVGNAKPRPGSTLFIMCSEG